MTLPDVFQVSHIVSGPRKSDGKYEVKWMGYQSDENTWEPRKNLPDSCFNEQLSSDESGDDQPLVEMVLQQRKEHVVDEAEVLRLANEAEVLRLELEEADNVRRQKLHDAAVLASRLPPPRTPRITPQTATRTTFESNRDGMRPKTNRKA
jgi:hypothetical protein